MINEDSIRAVNAARITESLTNPLMDTYNFSQIAQTLFHALTGESNGVGNLGLPNTVWGDLPQRYQKVIVILIDGFGWRFIERYADRYPFLKRFFDHGVVSKLSSQFPSTTSAHIPAIHTGLPLGESGFYEWYMYEPTLDRIIVPLMNNYSEESERNTLLRAGISSEALYPIPSLYPKYSALGVNATVIQSAEFTPSPFDVVCKGAKMLPFKSMSDGIVLLSEAVQAEHGKGFFYLYLGDVDSIGHVRGPSSVAYDAEVDTTLNALERLLYQTLQGKEKDTLLVLTADHGQIDVDPEQALYLNLFKPNIAGMVKLSRSGYPLIPAGSPRDIFLHIQSESLDAAAEMLTHQVKDKGTVYRVPDLIKQGIFGKVSQRFLDRVGDLVVIPTGGNQIWWDIPGKKRLHFYGQHGGMSREEMETVILMQALS